MVIKKTTEHNKNKQYNISCLHG